jgi:hypothetical protein
MVLPRRHERVVWSVVLGRYARPSARARAIASVRRWTWSLPKILRATAGRTTWIIGVRTCLGA